MFFVVYFCIVYVSVIFWVYFSGEFLVAGEGVEVGERRGERKYGGGGEGGRAGEIYRYGCSVRLVYDRGFGWRGRRRGEGDFRRRGRGGF